MSISSKSEARQGGALKIAMFEILEWKSRFTLGLTAAKNTDIIKKSFK